MAPIEWITINAENAKELNDKELQVVQQEIARREETSEVLNTPEKISDYPNLHPAKNISLVPELNDRKILDEGYLEYNNKKVPMFRNGAIEKAFNEMGIEIKEAQNTKEATQYLKELLKDYKKDSPDAFTQDDWFSGHDNTKFTLFDKRAKDKWLDYIGHQSPRGVRYWVGEELGNWLPVRIGGKFVYLCSNSADQSAECYYGNESDAMIITNTFSRPQKA